jgi:hypothetical protein
MTISTDTVSLKSINFKQTILGPIDGASPYLSLEIGTSSVDWAQQSRFYLMISTDSSLWNVVY